MTLDEFLYKLKGFGGWNRALRESDTFTEGVSTPEEWIRMRVVTLKNGTTSFNWIEWLRALGEPYSDFSPPETVGFIGHLFMQIDAELWPRFTLVKPLRATEAATVKSASFDERTREEMAERVAAELQQRFGGAAIYPLLADRVVQRRRPVLRDLSFLRDVRGEALVFYFKVDNTPKGVAVVTNRNTSTLQRPFDASQDMGSTFPEVGVLEALVFDDDVKLQDKQRFLTEVERALRDRFHIRFLEYDARSEEWVTATFLLHHRGFTLMDANSEVGDIVADMMLEAHLAFALGAGAYAELAPEFVAQPISTISVMALSEDSSAFPEFPEHVRDWTVSELSDKVIDDAVRDAETQELTQGGDLFIFSVDGPESVQRLRRSLEEVDVDISDLFEDAVGEDGLSQGDDLDLGDDAAGQGGYDAAGQGGDDVASQGGDHIAEDHSDSSEATRLSEVDDIERVFDDANGQAPVDAYEEEPDSSDSNEEEPKEEPEEEPEESDDYTVTDDMSDESDAEDVNAFEQDTDDDAMLDQGDTDVDEGDTDVDTEGEDAQGEDAQGEDAQGEDTEEEGTEEEDPGYQAPDYGSDRSTGLSVGAQQTPSPAQGSRRSPVRTPRGDASVDFDPIARLEFDDEEVDSPKRDKQHSVRQSSTLPELRGYLDTYMAEHGFAVTSLSNKRLVKFASAIGAEDWRTPRPGAEGIWIKDLRGDTYDVDTLVVPFSTEGGKYLVGPPVLRSRVLSSEMRNVVRLFLALRFSRLVDVDKVNDASMGDLRFTDEPRVDIARSILTDEYMHGYTAKCVAGGIDMCKLPRVNRVMQSKGKW